MKDVQTKSVITRDDQSVFFLFNINNIELMCIDKDTFHLISGRDNISRCSLALAAGIEGCVCSEVSASRHTRRKRFPRRV